MFTAVGDDDQSIYGWRGATIENLKRLPQDYPALKVIPLEQNYRSTGHILRAANTSSRHNPKLFEKKLWSEYGDGEPVRLVDATTRNTRPSGRWRASSHCAAQGGAVESADFAILYRANHQARVFEQTLRKAEIPYKVSGGQSFFDRAEIKDLCGWLRLLVNNDDDPASCAPSPRPSAASATRRWPALANSRQVEGEPVRGAVRRVARHRAAARARSAAA